MKINRLEIKNIASIEDAVIDFDKEPLSGTDLFLITGTLSLILIGALIFRPRRY